MKNIVSISLVITLFAFLTSCEKKSQKPEEIKSIVLEPQIHDNGYDSWPTLADEFTDIEIIPLENRKECLLSDVRKMIVTDSAMIFFSRNPIEKTISFSLNGQYRNCFGNKGNAKGEYRNVQNVATSFSGDTVVMIDIPDIKLYDSDGKYLSSLPIKNTIGVEDIFLTDKGAFLGYFHRQGTGIMSFYDKSFKNKKDIIKTPVNPFGYTWGAGNLNFIQKDRNTILCLDGLTTSFYAFDINSPEDVTRYSFHLDGVLTEEEARKNMGTEEVELFTVYSFLIYNGVVRGVILKNGECYDFEFSLSGKTVELIHHKGLGYSFDCCHSGFFYKIVTAEDLLDFMDESKRYMEPIRELLGNSLSNLKGKISPTDNHYVIKMRLKE